MKKEEISPELYKKILECFMKSIMKNGLKATTMDSIAASLQMSKRTLYEIFGTKEELFREVHEYFHKKTVEKMADIFANSSNVMEAIIKCFLFNRDFMSDMSPAFIRDMQAFANQRVENSEDKRRHHHQNLFDVLKKGVSEGYFRNDVNLPVQCKMLTLQMEALKSAEELFPDDISLLEIYDSIIIGFLRGISSPKGLEQLEKFMPDFNSVNNQASYLK